MSSGNNIVSSQDKVIENFIKARNRADSLGNATTHWGGAKTRISQYGSVRQSESGAQASSSNAITKFGEVAGGFGYLNQVGSEQSREKTPYQGKRPRPNQGDAKKEQLATKGHRAVIGLRIEKKANSGSQNIDVRHV